MTLGTAAMPAPKLPPRVELINAFEKRKPATLLSPSEELLQSMIEEEGAHRTVYRDVAGYPTVGIGHLVTPADHLQVGDQISRDQVLVVPAARDQPQARVVDGAEHAPGGEPRSGVLPDPGDGEDRDPMVGSPDPHPVTRTQARQVPEHGGDPVPRDVAGDHGGPQGSGRRPGDVPACLGRILGHLHRPRGVDTQGLQARAHLEARDGETHRRRHREHGTHQAVGHAPDIGRRSRTRGWGPPVRGGTTAARHHGGVEPPGRRRGGSQAERHDQQTHSKDEGQDSGSGGVTALTTVPTPHWLPPSPPRLLGSTVRRLNGRQKPPPWARAVLVIHASASGVSTR